MKPVEIKAALMLRAIQQSDIAEKLSVDPSLVNHVIHGGSKNLRVRKEIAARLNKDIKKIWPEEAYRRPNGRITAPVRIAA